MAGQTGFMLSKWYLDCVADDGSAFIGYAAELRWKTFPLHYSSILVRSAGGDVHTETSLLRGGFPQRDNRFIRWESRPLGIEAEWSGKLKSVDRQLYKSDGGSIEWSCLLPLARAQVRTGNSSVMKGSGYAEQLTLTIHPWRLPITELRWGRFLTNRDSVVWIDWRGEHPLTLVLRNGKEAAAPSITDSEVRDGRNFRLTLTPHATLRSGPIVSTTLSNVPGLAGVLPENILMMDECKWLSKGKLKLPESPARTGWAINEIVRFR